MKNFKKLMLGLAMAAMIAPAANATTINDEPVEGATVEAEAPAEFPVVIVNKTGIGIDAIYISDTEDEEWSDNFLEETLENGESVRIMCEDAGKYDISLTYADGSETELYNVTFKQSIRITLSLSSDGSKTIFSY